MGQVLQPSETACKNKGLQKKIYNILSSDRIDRNILWAKFRARLARWKLDAPSGIIIFRVYRRFQFLKGKVRPAILVAYFKLLMNSWITGRRLRTLATSAIPRNCRFCSRGDDSIEHMAECTVIRSEFERCRLLCRSLTDFLALDKASFPHNFIKKVKLLAAVYLTHSSLSTSSTPYSAPRLLNISVSSALNLH